MESYISTPASTATETILREEDGIIYFSVYSEAWSPLQWLTYFDEHHVLLSQKIVEIIMSVRFKPTIGERKFAVIKGENFKDEERTLSNIINFAYSKGFHRSNAENICLLRKALTDDDLERFGLSDVIAVRTGYKLGGKPCLGQIAGQLIEKERFHGVNTTNASLNRRLHRKKGFAFFEKTPKEIAKEVAMLAI